MPHIESNKPRVKVGRISIRRCMAFVHSWARHETDCAIHQGEECSCGFFDQLAALERAAAGSGRGDGKRHTASH